MPDVCSIGGNFLATWATLCLLSLISVTLSSSLIFKLYYMDITFEKWQQKINPEYPSAKKVRDEIVLMLKGLVFSNLSPAISLYLSSHGLSKAYCTYSPQNVHSLEYHVVQFLAIVLISDLYEWYYHRMGHVYKACWEIHRHHHVFYNPSPFSVISDEYIDQFARALPLVIFPLVTDINMELLFGTYAIFFYVYGVYLHWGHELEWLDAHHPIVNTSYQHYAHHAKSIYGRPYHTGFFFKCWDQLAGSVLPPDKCDCLNCQKKGGGRDRTRAQFEAVVRPDYSILWKDFYIWWADVHYDNPDASAPKPKKVGMGDGILWEQSTGMMHIYNERSS